MKRRAVRKPQTRQRLRILRVEREDVQVCICIGDEQREALRRRVRQELARQRLEAVPRAPKEDHLVRLLGVSREPHALEGVAHEQHARARQRLEERDVALHVHEGDGQQRAVLLEPAHHALLPLRHDQEALGAELRDGGYCAFDLVFHDEAEPAVGFGAGGLWHHGDDFEDADAAFCREVFAVEGGGADGDELFALVRRFGDFEGEGFDAEDYFLGIEDVRVDDGPGLLVDDFEDASFDVRFEGYVWRVG